MKNKQTEDLCRMMWSILNYIDRQALSDTFLLGNCGKMECDIHKVEMDWAKAERETQEARKEASRKDKEKGLKTLQKRTLMELNAISREEYLATLREIKKKYLQ